MWPYLLPKNRKSSFAGAVVNAASAMSKAANAPSVPHAVNAPSVVNATRAIVAKVAVHVKNVTAVAVVKAKTAATPKVKQLSMPMHRPKHKPKPAPKHATNASPVKKAATPANPAPKAKAVASAVHAVNVAKVAVSALRVLTRTAPRRHCHSTLRRTPKAKPHKPTSSKANAVNAAHATVTAATVANAMASHARTTATKPPWRTTQHPRPKPVAKTALPHALTLSVHNKPRLQWLKLHLPLQWLPLQWPLKPHR